MGLARRARAARTRRCRCASLLFRSRPGYFKIGGKRGTSRPFRGASHPADGTYFVDSEDATFGPLSAARALGPPRPSAAMHHVGVRATRYLLLSGDANVLIRVDIAKRGGGDAGGSTLPRWGAAVPRFPGELQEEGWGDVEELRETFHLSPADGAAAAHDFRGDPLGAEDFQQVLLAGAAGPHQFAQDFIRSRGLDAVFPFFVIFNQKQQQTEQPPLFGKEVSLAALKSFDLGDQAVIFRVTFDDRGQAFQEKFPV